MCIFVAIVCIVISYKTLKTKNGEIDNVEYVDENNDNDIEDMYGEPGTFVNHHKTIGNDVENKNVDNVTFRDD